MRQVLKLPYPGGPDRLTESRTRRHWDREKDRGSSCHIGLDRAWIKHDTDALANGGSWQVLAELCADVAIASVGCDDAAPHDAILAQRAAWGLLVGESLVDVGDALAHVELGILAVLDALDLKARLAAMLVASVALVANMYTLRVQSHGLRHLAG